MKVYVDELPKGAIEYGCDNCPYAEILGINHYIINGEFVDYRDCVCKLDKTCGFRLGEKHCPLQSLADYTKQVRKEVCEEIKQKSNKKVEKCIYENYITGKDEVVEIHTYSISEVQLDQIQGEKI